MEVLFKDEYTEKLIHLLWFLLWN